MEFDKTRVYTAVNADELKVGSKCIFADSFDSLKDQVEAENPNNIEILKMIEEANRINRFVWTDTYKLYHNNLAYLIEPPKEPEYKPFSSVEKAREIIDKHGGWVKQTDFEHYYLVFGFRSDAAGLWVLMEYGVCNFKELFDSFVFADDGSPCGELVEE